jgi:hypothetical protein
MTFISDEQKELGRRTFLKALAGTPAVALLGAAAIARAPLRGGPVRMGIIGLGVQGRALSNHLDPAYADLRAICDINPAQLARADEALLKRSRPAARHYAEWRDLLGKEDLEAVLVALPLWAHAEVTAECLNAGKHVLCEKMMAWDVAGCERMIEAGRRNERVLETNRLTKASSVAASSEMCITSAWYGTETETGDARGNPRGRTSMRHVGAIPRSSIS